MFQQMQSWNSFRNRIYLRNTLVASTVLFIIYVLYTTALQRTPFSSTPGPKDTAPDVPAPVWNTRAEKVKAAFQHAYHGYEQYAAPHDELKPLSRGSSNPFNGWGVTAFDSLDTMLLMHLDVEFARALTLVARADFALEPPGVAPFFETVIRYLGGLLAAHALSHEPVLLERADALAEALDPIFATPSGFPRYAVNPTKGTVVGPEIGILAEMASLQLEYTYLAKLTGKKRYFDRADTVNRALAAADLRKTYGMFPIRWNLTSGQPHDLHLSVGAQADSAHEYLLKQYLLTAKTEKASLEMYIRATSHILKDLLYLSPKRHLLYVTDTRTAPAENGGSPTHILEHLSCFLPGLLALGAHTLPLDDLDALGVRLPEDAATAFSGFSLKDLHLWAAEGIAQTCWLTYADQPTGLGPEEVLMYTGADMGEAPLHWIDTLQEWKRGGARGAPPGVGRKAPIVYSAEEVRQGSGRGRDYALRKTEYLLRPETVESLYVLWRVTGDYRWRQRGWTIFEAIERETKTPAGYASVRSVEHSPASHKDEMPSYFLAETLKYLYLLFGDTDPWPLDAWVFNTEAHPLPVFEWTAAERARFGM